MMTQPLATPTQYPGSATRAPTAGDDSDMFDELQHSLVEQRMTTRLEEAEAARLARLASPSRGSTPMRARIGRVLIGLGATIAGGLDEPTPKRLT